MKKYVPKKMVSTLQRLKRIIIILLYKIFSLIKIEDSVVLYSPSNNRLHGNLLYIYKYINNKKIYQFFNKSNIVKLIYRVATSKIVITDDYAPILYPIKFRKNTKFIQVWHASGVFKKVGFTRLGTSGGPSENSITHKNYTDVIVSSTDIVEEYSKTFKIDEVKIKPLGTPRTDLFFDNNILQELKEKFIKKYPKCINKKVILYAPTFRGNGKKSAYTDTNILDLEKLVNNLSKDYILLVKTHPFTKNKFNINNDRVIDISIIDDVNEILPFIDILITDYSSIIFDALLLNKNTILYVPDLEKYKNSRGLYYDIEEYNFGSIVKNESELIKSIINPIFDLEKAKRIKEKHLNMCDGFSTKRFIDTYLK